MHWATPSRGRHFIRSAGVGVGLAGTLVLLMASASAESPERYPYDPACPWGRLADGHGMLIRCLDPAEASQLLQAESSPAPAAAPKEPAASASDRTAPKPAAGQKLRVTAVGPVQADTGELPLAEKKLSLPKDRYVDCVRQHGGLSEANGRVVVRFLVRERGRAEGVSVKSVKGMAPEAAKCIADVVDRRYVGYPAAPIVGATIVIELSATP